MTIYKIVTLHIEKLTIVWSGRAANEIRYKNGENAFFPFLCRWLPYHCDSIFMGSCSIL